MIYWLVTAIRNSFYNFGIFKTSKFNLPVISVGNLSMGGTGKTPLVEYLVRLLKDENELATLSRGFGRKVYGFQIADEESNALAIGDEPFQYYRKFSPDIKVVVDTNRVTGVMDLCRDEPQTNLVLLDDAYQHRAIHRGLNILVSSYDKPYYSDWVLPVGELRESRLGKKRADIILISKCPDFENINQAEIKSKIKANNNQMVFFSKIIYGPAYDLLKGDEVPKFNQENILLVTGIGDSNHLVNQLKKENTILHHFNFSDHHQFKKIDIEEIHKLIDKFASKKPVIVTTEKDAMRLLNADFHKILTDKPWFYQSIEVEIQNKEAFNNIILDYVKKNN